MKNSLLKFILWGTLICVFSTNTFSQTNHDNQIEENEISFEEYDEQSEILKSEYKPRFGIFANYGLNFHHAKFKELPQYPICCNLFKSGFGTGLNFGGLVQFRFDENWFYGGKLHFGNLNGIIKKEQKEPVTVAGMLIDGKTKNVIDVSLNNLVFSPFVAYFVPQVSPNFYVTVGASIGYTVSANFAQYEELIHPQVGTFENGYRIRNIKSGDLPNLNIMVAGNIGAGYELPMNKQNNLRLTPEINYNYWFVSPVKNLNWSVSQLTFGVAVRYHQPPQKEQPIEPVLPELPALELPKPDYKFIVDVDFKILDSSFLASKEQIIVIEEFTQTNLKPLLNYIFFDENSSEIPARYNRIDGNATDTFNYSQLQSFNALETYYHCLNIIGYRLRQYQSATIELIGTNANKGEERNNTDISRARAESVKKYLSDVWKIAPSRIKTTARNLPKEPTRPTESSSGDDENRRVEVFSSDSRIIEPILSFDTVSVLRNERINFYPIAESSFGIKDWKLEVRNTDSVVISWAGEANLPNEIAWETTNKYLVAEIQNAINFQLIVNDEINQTEKSQEKNIPINRITVASKRSDNELIDTEYEYYSLILFDFASRNLDTRHNKVIDFIKSRISPNSKVIISGYTDIIGQHDVNKRIATERAREAANRLQFNNVEIRGIGNDELLYDNTFPEGRFYCRTVTISIETPITGTSD